MSIEEIDWLVSNCVLNSGCVYYAKDKYALINVLAKSIRDYVRWPQIMAEDTLCYYPDDKKVEITPDLLERLKGYVCND